MTVPMTTTVAAEEPVGREQAGWTPVCALADLEPERGVAALVGGRQVALFRTWAGTVHAVDHLDPFSAAYVMARGIVGTRGDAPTVASPMYKQVFDLRTGGCLDEPGVALAVHDVRVRDGVVEVAVRAAGPVAAP